MYSNYNNQVSWHDSTSLLCILAFKETLISQAMKVTIICVATP